MHMIYLLHAFHAIQLLQTGGIHPNQVWQGGTDEVDEVARQHRNEHMLPLEGIEQCQESMSTGGDEAEGKRREIVREMEGGEVRGRGREREGEGERRRDKDRERKERSGDGEKREKEKGRYSTLYM